MQLSVKDVAQLFRLTQDTVYRWVDEGRLPAQLVGESFRFNRAELLEWATAEGIPVSPEVFSDPTSDEVRPTLSAALALGGVFHHVAGDDKHSVLRSAVQALKLPDDVDREALLAVLLARESLGSTGIGNGIAIPHVRNPIVLHLSQPAVALCFLDKPVDFDAIDGQAVHTLFLITSPTIRAHLHLLARLAFVLQQPEMAAALTQRSGASEILPIVESLEARLPLEHGRIATTP